MIEEIRALMFGIGFVVVIATLLGGVISYIFLLSDVRDIHKKICGEDKGDKP